MSDVNPGFGAGGSPVLGAVAEAPEVPEAPQEEGYTVGGPLTAEKLRFIADWLDATDPIVAKWGNVVHSDKAFNVGDGVQDDLRRWAVEIEQAMAVLQNEGFPADPPAAKDEGYVLQGNPAQDPVPFGDFVPPPNWG